MVAVGLVTTERSADDVASSAKCVTTPLLLITLFHSATRPVLSYAHDVVILGIANGVLAWHPLIDPQLNVFAFTTVNVPQMFDAPPPYVDGEPAGLITEAFPAR